MTDDHEKQDILDQTSKIVAAYVSNNHVSAKDLSGLILSVHQSLSQCGAPVEAVLEPREPAVSIKKSVFPDYLVCLEDGKHLKMLKRYIRTNFNLTPEEYRERWGLPLDYPMVAPNYAMHRSTLAKSIGLGHRQKTESAT